jgi:hypothetical protein
MVNKLVSFDEDLVLKSANLLYILSKRDNLAIFISANNSHTSNNQNNNNNDNDNGLKAEVSTPLVDGLFVLFTLSTSKSVRSL